MESHPGMEPHPGAESHPGNVPSQKLRAAIALDSATVPAWIASAIVGVSATVQLVAAVLLPESESESKVPYLLGHYIAWDARRNLVPVDPLEPTDISATVDQLPAATLETLPVGLDLLLWFSDADPTQLPVTTRCGLWFVSHGLAGRSSYGQYFPELVRQEPLSSSYLLALRAPGHAPVRIAEAHAATEIGWSLKRQQTALFWKAASMVRSAILDCQRSFDRPSESLVSDALGSHSVALFAARNLARTVQRRLRYAGKESHWFVAYRTNPALFAAHVLAHSDVLDSAGWTKLDSPHDHFYADPFVLTWQGRTFLFVEDYLYEQRRGIISILEFLPDGSFGPAREILNRPYHLSYPFVFEHEGEVYMIPESMEAHRIELYRAVEMPYRWELLKVLQDDVEAVDTTLWIEDGAFFFFTNLTQPGMTPNDLLFLFTSDSLTGTWHPHPANPVSLDVRAARGAGKLFRAGNRLIRPAQDCSVRYGYATQLNEVEVLTPTHFRERLLLRIEPDWAPELIGTHTINSNDVLEVIDGQVYRDKYRKRSGEL